MKKTKINPKHLYAIFAFLLSAVVVFCGVQIWREYDNRQKDIDAFAELAELAEIKEPDEPKETAEPDSDGDTENSDTDTQEEQEVPSPTPRHDIPLLISQNSDCIGWITIDNTAVDYPVMHTPDWPQKYLRMNFSQQYSDSGVPFLDYRCTLDSDNLIIFGHNMHNGTMFSALKDYLSDGHLASHPTIRLETEDGAHEFTIFAVACVDKLDSWYSFINAESEDGFNEAVQRVFQNAYHTNGDAPKYRRAVPVPDKHDRNRIYPKRYEACPKEGLLDHSGISEYRGFFDPLDPRVHKALFSIPTHQFLFNAGQINPKEYMDALQVEPSEFELIKYPERGTCLFRCGNERYLLQVIAPDYKAALFGKAGGR